MRVAIVTESFLPHMNGVTGSVLQILRHLERRGHDACVIAPDAPRPRLLRASESASRASESASRASESARRIPHWAHRAPEPVGEMSAPAPSGAGARETGLGRPAVPIAVHGALIHTVPSIALPGYASVRVGTASAARIQRRLGCFAPDVVHLASPFALGWRGVSAADRLDVASVAAYQTDVASYAARYGVRMTRQLAEGHIARLHRRATLNLVPSTESEQQLRELGVDRVRRWGRGVDAHRFDPAKRDEAWRAQFGDDTVVGYVGRLAPEKQVADLTALAGLDGVRLVIVGDGPLCAQLEQSLPSAVFTGHLEGERLAQVMASLDIFVHTGEAETFGQTLQEAHASGVPVVATGRGGPLDLVRSSVDGWLYRPGDMRDLRARVQDLAGDARKRRAFGAAGRAAVEPRSWEAICDQLMERFDEARSLRRIDTAARIRRAVRPEPAAPQAPARWQRFVAIGDSLTEGLCDPAPDGSLRGWADRLALLLASDRDLRYANLAVRSRRVRDAVGEQLRRARELRPDLVSILIGANDLVHAGSDPAQLAAEVEQAVRRLREDGADVLLVTPFLPDRAASKLFTARFAAFATHLAGVAARTGAILLDTDLHPSLGDRPNWGEDLVHLSSAGHRFLAYRAAELLRVPNAEALGALDASLHQRIELGRAAWWRWHALPWMWRRLRGRSAGDGLVAKHDDYVRLGRNWTSARQPVPER